MCSNISTPMAPLFCIRPMCGVSMLANLSICTALQCIIHIMLRGNQDLIKMCQELLLISAQVAKSHGEDMRLSMWASGPKCQTRCRRSLYLHQFCLMVSSYQLPMAHFAIHSSFSSHACSVSFAGHIFKSCTSGALMLCGFKNSQGGATRSQDCHVLECRSTFTPW